MERYIRAYQKETKRSLGKVRKWLLGLLTPAFAVCLAVGLFLYVPASTAIMSYAAVEANPLINSNIGKHSEWYYGFGTVDDPTTTKDVEAPTLDAVSGGYARWYAQLGVDVGDVKVGSTTITQEARAHQLVQASSYKEGTTDKVFIINTPEEAAKVWTEAVEYALGQSANSPFKVNRDGTELENGLKQTYQDQSKDPITGEVQKIPGGGTAHGNYFADPYYVSDVNGSSEQIGYKGQYITVKLNCDWYAKDIETNIAFALGNTTTVPSEQTISHDARWITTFNWAADKETFDSYWLGDGNWADSASREAIRSGYSQSVSVKEIRSDSSTVTNEQKTTFTTDGHGYSSTDGYYASYDLSTMADQVANAGGKAKDGGHPGFNISSPFSYGRINVPTGAYIVLDLNGHTISRGLTEENTEEISYHGSILKSKYEYDLGEMDELNQLVQIYDGSTLATRDNGHLYGNELCYYGSVMTVQPKARLEIVDSTAYERASDGRIDRLDEHGKKIDADNTSTLVKSYATNHKGTVTGGCTDDKYYVYMDNDLGVENGAYFGYNTNEGKGGAVHVNASGELVVHSGTFKDNQAVYGGAFYALSRAAVLVYNGYFINNYATMHGGATYVASASRSVFTFYDGVISYNRAAQTGGGVFLRDNAYVNLHGGYITYNQAGYQGGGVYIGSGGEGLLENVNITHNVAGHEGGGIYVFGNSKFQFAGSLIVTQNYGNCGDFNTREVGEWGGKNETFNGLAGNTYRMPYILRLKVDGEYLVACGTGSQSRYDWERTTGALTLTSGYKQSNKAPACPHVPKHSSEHPMWSMGDAFSKEYNGIGGVVWKNVNGGRSAHGDVTKIAKEGSDNNVYLESGAKIIIDGPLFANGIGAQIGVTMAGTGDFTTSYKDKEGSKGSVEPHLYFTSDDSTKSVVWNTGETEATLGSKTTEPDELTWEITGNLYGKTDAPITITASGDDAKYFTWQEYAPANTPAGSTPSTQIKSFTWTGKTMMFDHKMFEVTKVVAKQGGTEKGKWDIGSLNSEDKGTAYSFHYLLEKSNSESDLINEGERKALIYAGDYSFRVTSGNYSNATFTIHINQLGVGVSAYEVKDGETTWKGKENIFKDGATPNEGQIKTYLEGALYYRGTAYDFVLDKAYREGKEGEYKSFTGAVMKFTYANKDFFGSDVEIDFGAVDFDLEYYWRELTDNSQQELEKTNYFLHAGFYEVRGAHEIAKDGGDAPSVDYMKNNIAFQSEMHLPIQRVSVSVWLVDDACVKDSDYFGYTYKDGIYTTKQILYFNNDDEAGNDPELDENVVVHYYKFDDYLKYGSEAPDAGIRDATTADGVERWGVKDAGKYVVHVSLNAMLWREGDAGKDDFTPRGKPYNDYIFTSNETQRLFIEPTIDEQGREVEYEFAYYFFIQPAVVTEWVDESDPSVGGNGHLNFEDRIYDATNTEPAISGKMKSATENNAYYSFGDIQGDNEGVYVRYLEKTAENTDNLGADDETLKGDHSFTYEDVAQYGALTAAELKSVSNAAIAKWFQEETKFKPVDAGDYWILVWFRGVSPVAANKGSGGKDDPDPQREVYNPVTNFKGVYIGTYTIKPVEVTVSGSLSYTYDGSSFERARFLSAHDEHSDWYESIFFLVQDGITTPNELVVNQHADTYTTPDTYQSWEGGEAQNRSLRDLWGGNNTYNDAVYYKSRFTLGNVTVTYTNEEFKQNEISLGIGLYAFKTSSANVGNYHLTTVPADTFATEKKVVKTARVTEEPEEVGATWIITYQPKGGQQVQAFNTSQNFVISSTSFLDVNITQKNIGELASDIVKVGNTSFTHWNSSLSSDGKTLTADGKTGIEYPFAGNGWIYQPKVDIKYQPFYYGESVTREEGKTAYGTALELSNEDDFTISYVNNSSASTTDNPARINLQGRGNYTGSLALTFTITPAKIAVQYAGVGAVPQYDRTAHSVNVQYTNAEDEGIYGTLQGAGILVRSSGSGDFTKPQPDQSVYSITYKARLRTEGGFGEPAEDPNDITDSTVPINAGVYDVKIFLGSNDYQFVNGTGEGSYFTPVAAAVGEKYSKTATGSHTILPAVVRYQYANNNEVYNRQAHTPQIEFTNVSFDKYRTDLKSLQYVVPQSTEYTVEIALKGTSVYGEDAIDAGSYTVKVTLSSHNYCFELKLTKDANEKFITGYEDGSTGEDNYPSSENTSTFSYNYTVRDASGTQHDVNDSWTAPGDYVINKATITLGKFDDCVYNRAAQVPNIVFSNTQNNNEAVPTLSGENAGKNITNPEYKITYKDEGIISSTNSLNEDGKPFYSDLYSVEITLTPEGAKNFKFEAKEITAPHFTHGEKGTVEARDPTLLTQRPGDSDSIILAPFLINRVDITVTQMLSTDVYNADDHFVEDGVTGIAVDAVDAVTYWVSEMFRYSSSAAIAADDLTVDVIFTKGKEATDTATVHYTPSGSKDTVEYNGKSYSFEDFAKEVGFFTHVATYTVTVQFSEESFYISNTGADDDHLSLDFAYSITPAQISFSLSDTSISYDAKGHQLTYKKEGTERIVLTNSANGDVLPVLVEGTGTGIDQGALAYSYSGWAGIGVEKSAGYSNVGTYTVTITLQDGGDFQFANSSYTMSQDYSITAMDIGAANFGTAVFTQDTTAGHEGYTVPAYHYTGKEIQPVITLTDIKKYGITLKTTNEGVVGLSVAYTENVNAGSAKAMLRGINNFTGSREETFYILPAIVSVTASDNSGNSEAFNPNTKPETVDKGSLTFSYNKTAQTVTFAFANLCGSETTTPNSSDYIVEYYKATDWDEANNKPNKDAKALNGVTDQGEYFVWISFTKGGRIYSNFVFYKEKSDATEIGSMFATSEPFFYAYKFQIAVKAAEIEIHLADDFRAMVDGENQFVNSFGFNKSDWTKVLNSIDITGNTVPASGDYELFFSSDGTDGMKITDATNVGTYYLVFKMNDGKGNYVVKTIYADSGEHATAVPRAETKDGDGYFAEGDTIERFSVKFTVDPADIEIHLAESFKSGSGFVNSFVYDKSNRASTLRSVDITGAVQPASGEYSVVFKTSLEGDTTTADITNVGTYYLVFKLTDTAGNYNVTAIYAGDDVVVEQKGDGGYVGETKKDFSVKFDITPAEIQIHLADGFQKDSAFNNKFVYNRTDQSIALGTVRITNSANTVPLQGEYTVVFKTSLAGAGANADTVTDVGMYYLVFTLNGDAATNYKVTGIFAGSGTTTAVPKATAENSDGYYSATAILEEGTVKNFSVKFEITKAVIEVHLSTEFVNEGTFRNSFTYNKTDRQSALKGITFGSGTSPNESEYTVSFLLVGDSETATETVLNAGSYKLSFKLNGDGAKNFTVGTIYAGDVELTEGQYEPEDPDNSFTVAFTIAKAKIAVHLAGDFRKGSAFNNEFVYNRTSWIPTLSVVSITGVDGNTTIPFANEYTITFVQAEKGDATVTNVGTYQLKFELTDTAGNYDVTAIYAGTGTTTEVPVASGENENGYFGTMKNFSVKFDITPAEVDLYLNSAFVKDVVDGKTFTNEFVYDGTDQSNRLAVVEFQQENGIIPAPDAYTVTFFYDLDNHRNDSDDVAVYDAGKYTLFFRFTEAANGNFTLGNVYAGSTSGSDSSVKLVEENWSEKSEKQVKVNFEVKPSEINVFFSSSYLKDAAGNYVNSFAYDRSDWTSRFGMVTFSAVGDGATPKTTEYSIEYYSGTLADGKETWNKDNPVSEIINVGRYSVTFRLSKEGTGYYPGAKHYNNYTLVNVYAGGGDADKSVQLEKVNAPAANGYRTSTETKNDVYVTLVFDITPANIEIHLADPFESGGKFVNSFVYNTSNRALTLNTSNITGATIPLSTAYSFEFKTDLSGEATGSVIDVGTYYLVFNLDDEEGNYNITGIYAGSGIGVKLTEKEDGGYVGETMKAFSVKFFITQAEIDVYLSSTFKGEEGFVKEFDYNRTDWAGKLSQVTFNATNGSTIPTGEDYTLAVQKTLEDAATVAAINAGDYYLVFKLSNPNFKINNIFAGTQSGYVNAETTTTADGFYVDFTVKKAQIEVYLSLAFKSGETFVNEFGYNTADRASTLGTVTFKNVLRNGVVPVGDDYTVTFLKGTEGTAQVINAGSYTLKFALADTDEAKNFVIVHVRAGTAPAKADGKEGFVELVKDTNFTASDVVETVPPTEVELFRAFDVSFTIKKAQIEIHLADEFTKSEGTAFNNSFVYNRTSQRAALSEITIKGFGGNTIIPLTSEYTITITQVTGGSDSVTDAGKYQLAFVLSDAPDNYDVVGIYAGDDVKLQKVAEGKGEYEGTPKNFTVQFEITKVVLEVHLSGDFAAETGFLDHFPYNKTDRMSALKAVTFGDGTSPNESEYSVSFVYNSAPATTIINAGDYTLKFTLTEDGAKNFTVGTIYAGTDTSAKGHYKPDTPDESFTVAFTIDKATVDVYLPAAFVKDGAFNSAFDYDRSDWINRLNTLTFTNGADKTVPTLGEDYSLTFETLNKDGTITNAGSYTLAFGLSNANFTIGDVYAGESTSAAGHYTPVDPDTFFTVAFTVNKAKIEVYLPEAFRSDKNFVNSFGFNKNDWESSLKAVQFKNELRNAIVPEVSEYTLTFETVNDDKTTGPATTVTNVGNYQLVLEIIGDDAKNNFVITKVRAGTPPENADGTDGFAELTKGKDYTTSDEENMLSFTVAFVITPAQIQVHVSDKFIGEGDAFFNQFGFNKNDWTLTLRAIELTGTTSNIVPTADGYTVSFTKGGADVTDATDVGEYYLVFTFTDVAASNYVITGIYAGSGTDFDVRDKAGEAYEALAGTIDKNLTKFRIAFSIVPAEIDLYLNAFRAGEAFTNQFVFNGTDQSVTLKAVGLKNDANIVPAEEVYSVTFAYTEAPATGKAAAAIIDAGGYSFTFTLSSPNYVLRNVYVGSIDDNSRESVELQEGERTSKTKSSLSLNFAVTPATIDVYFTATELKSDNTFVNSFYYDRNNWASRLGIVSLDNTMEGNSAVPQGHQFSIKHYKCDSFTEGVAGSESWSKDSTPVDSATDVGRYSVTFRLSKDATGYYEGKKHYNNYNIGKVYVGGTSTEDSVELKSINLDENPTGKDGYRTSKDLDNDVYVTIVFDVIPVVVKLDAIGNKVYNGKPQDAGFTFTTVHGNLTPQESDYTAVYSKVEGADNANALLDAATTKPLNAGKYNVSIELTANFVFEKADKHTANGTFSITPAVLSAYLGYLEDGVPVRGELSMDYDGLPHAYSVFTEMSSAEPVDRVTEEGEGQNCKQSIAINYNGWAGVSNEEVDADTLSDGYKNAGTYTLVLSYYIVGTDTLGGNFCFGNDTYTFTLTYTILARTITDEDVTGIEKGEEKVYNGKPQTDGIVVAVELTTGAGKTELVRYDTVSKKGDYSISNTSDIYVGDVETNVIGMNNFKGTVNLTYTIIPATVTAKIDKTTAFYDRSEQVRSFNFVNTAGTTVVPAFNTANTDNSDYTITYTFNGNEVKAPRNAGVYTVTVTLQNSTGIEGNQPNFKFASPLDGATRMSDYTATFTFTIEKAQITLAAIPYANYTGEQLPAQIAFVNAANPSVVPAAYTVTYDEEGDAPTHVKTDEGSRTPIAYRVRVTLLNRDANATDAERDLDNFVFIEGSGTYLFDTEKGTWGEEAYTVMPAEISGSLSVKIEGEDKPAIDRNTYNAKEHALDILFRNIQSAFDTVVPKGTKGEVVKSDLTAAYTYTGEDGKELYTLTIVFTPNYNGFTEFDGKPVNAGSYKLTIDLISADFSFVNASASYDWTYTIDNAKIANQKSLGTSAGGTTFTRELIFAPNAPQAVELSAEDFIFVDGEDGFNAGHATFAFTSCTGAAYSPITDGSGLQKGYLLEGAGEYTIVVTVDAPNHDPWEITLKVNVKATRIELTVRLDAKFGAVYGNSEAYSAETVLKKVLDFIREGKIIVEGIGGSNAEKANALVSYGFSIRLLTIPGDSSSAGLLKVKEGGYGLKIDNLAVSGFDGDSFVVFSNGTTEYSGTVFTVSPLAIQISKDDAINDLRYNGNSLVNEAARYIHISNLFEKDSVSFESVDYNESESGNFSNGTVFEKVDAIHVGNYWVHLTGRTTALSGADAGNYYIETKDQDSDSIRYAGADGVYVAFEIKRREVELALAASSSVYGDDAAVYGSEGAKSFSFSYTDRVLTTDFGSLEKAPELKKFVLDLLALFDAEEGTKLDRDTTPYPAAGSYLVKLDPAAGKTAEGDADWVLGDGRFNFDKDFILCIDESQSGAHTVTKRPMRVFVHDYSTYYGEKDKEDGFEGSEGAWGYDVLTEFVGTDSEVDLGITIVRNGRAFMNQAQQAKSGHWPAKTYVGGLHASSISANYEVTFTEGSGNYIINPRPITVLIGSQSSVYGEPIYKDNDLSGLENNWEIYGTLNEKNMDYAPRESRPELDITLTVAEVVNTDASAGVYHNAIVGSCGNPNYEVTFYNWVVKDGKNEPGEYTGGDYEITKRTVAIKIGTADSIYGTQGLHVGAKIELTEPVYADGGLKNRDTAQWTYNFDKARYTILPEHLGYLTFYLGKADPANAEKLYATEGPHAIVGRWGYGYDGEMVFMKSYEVTFYGDWKGEGESDENYLKAGTYTITPADITQRRESDWETSCVFRMGPEDGDKTPLNGWYAMQISAEYLVYAGDYKDASGGTLVFNAKLSDETTLVYDVMVGDAVRATVTYAKPVNTTEADQTCELVENLWSVHEVGTWTMTVTVSAANHKKATFTLTYYVVSVTAKVMLNTSIAAHEKVYGEYDYIELEPGEIDYSKVYDETLKDLPLTIALHDYLESAIMGVDGLAEAYPGTGALEWRQMILDNCWVEVVDAKISSAGKLRAGRYHLRIVAKSGCGFTVTFVDGTPNDGIIDFSGYDRLIIDQKELGISWVHSDRELHLNETMPDEADGKITYTYSSYGYDYKTLFTDVLERDEVADPDTSFLNEKNAPCTPKDVGNYRIAVADRLSGKDAGNYKLPATHEIDLEIVPMKVVVTLRNREVTYGERHETLADLAPTIKDGVVTDNGAAWLCDRIGFNDGVSALALAINIVDGEGNAIERTSDAGIYRIVGSSESLNYAVTFRSETDEGKTEAVYTVYRRDITFEIESLSDTYGGTRTKFDGYRRTDGSLAPWHSQIADVGVSLSVDFGEKCNVGFYPICGTWTNTNYNVLFTGDWAGELPEDYLQQDRLGNPTEEKQGAGTYTVGERTVHLTMQEENTSVYGDVSFDGDMETPTFESKLRETFKLAAGYELAKGDEIKDLKIRFENLPTAHDADRYTDIEAVEDNDPNYIITFVNKANWEVTKREVTITVHTQQSAYGDEYVTLNGDDPTFWNASGLAPWHTDPVEALKVTLSYNTKVLAEHANAGTYKFAITATPTANTNNYSFVYKNDANEEGCGTYIVGERVIHLTMQEENTSIYGDVSYSDTYGTTTFEKELRDTFALAESYKLAEGDEITDLKIRFNNLPASHDVDIYRNIEAVEDNDSNYEIHFEGVATWEVTKREVTVTVSAQNSAYGDDYVELKNDDLTFWHADNLAPWHVDDPAAALKIELSYDTKVLAEHANAGTYPEAIQATATGNTGNYTFVYVKGTYTVDQRVIHLTMKASNTSIYGDVSFDGDMGTPMFADKLRETFKLAAGYELAKGDEIKDLKIRFENLPTAHDVDTYRNIEAVEDNDSNYEIHFDNEATWEVTKREVTITVHTQQSAYGDDFVTLNGDDESFWNASGLAPWHTDPVAALDVTLGYNTKVLAEHANAGTYKFAITATPGANTNNYSFVYKNDANEEGFGTYIVSEREIWLEIQDYECTYGDYYDEKDFNKQIVGGYKLDEESTLAPWDAENENFVLKVTLFKAVAGYRASVYPISGRDEDSNYAIYFVREGNFTIHQATNEWRKHFSLESMNEGDTPDGDLLSATAKFGTAVVKYYYDENCETEVTEELNALPKSTYYAKITVDGTSDYTGLEEVKAFVVNESFLIVNGGLDVTLYVCIFASQFIILTFALIFIRRRKQKKDETEEMK